MAARSSRVLPYFLLSIIVFARVGSSFDQFPPTPHCGANLQPAEMEMGHEPWAEGLGPTATQRPASHGTTPLGTFRVPSPSPSRGHLSTDRCALTLPAQPDPVSSPLPLCSTITPPRSCCLVISLRLSHCLNFIVHALYLTMPLALTRSLSFLFCAAEPCA